MRIYYQSKEMLEEMLYTVFVFGFKYSSEKSFAQHIIEMFKTPQYIMLGIIPIVTLLCDKKKNYRKVLFMLMSTGGTMLAICMGNNYYHYYTLLAPVIVYSEIILVNDIIAGQKKDRRQIIAVVFLCVAVLAQSERVAANVYHSYDYLINGTDKYIVQSQDVASHIPNEDKDSIFGYDIVPCWYAYTDNVPCIKYCGWQNHYISLVPEIEDEMAETFKNTPPKWLVLPEKIEKLPEFMRENLNKNYNEVYINELFRLYEYNK